MSTTIRPEISEKNRYWIDKHRYYELKHFCLQYPVWKMMYLSIDGFSKNNLSTVINSTLREYGNPTEKCVIEKNFYLNRMEMIRKASKIADAELSDYIFKAVTQGYSYTYLKTKLEIPCSKETYYNRYRKFFWILSGIRK